MLKIFNAKKPKMPQRVPFYGENRRAKAFIVWCIKNHGYEYDMHNITLTCPSCGNVHRVDIAGNEPCLYCDFDWIENKKR